MKIDIKEIKQIRKLEVEANEQTINKMLKEGWILLSVNPESYASGNGLSHTTFATLGSKKPFRKEDGFKELEREGILLEEIPDLTKRKKKP